MKEKTVLLDHKSRQGFDYSSFADLNSPVRIKVKGDDAPFTLTTELYDPTERRWRQVAETTERVHTCDTFGRVRFGLNVPNRASLGVVEIENA